MIKSLIMCGVVLLGGLVCPAHAGPRSGGRTEFVGKITAVDVRAHFITVVGFDRASMTGKKLSGQYTQKFVVPPSCRIARDVLPSGEFETFKVGQKIAVLYSDGGAHGSTASEIRSAGQ